MRGLVLILFIWMQTGLLYAQLGGNQSFEFLNLPVGAKAAALGGIMSATIDGNVNTFLSNPSLLDSTTSNHVSWSNLGFYAGVQYNSFAYTKNTNRLGMIAVGVQQLNYGSIIRRDATGQEIGSFDATQMAIVLSHSQHLGIFRMGVSMRYIHSLIDTQSASAVAFDVAGSFIHPNQAMVVSILVKNVGVILSNFSATALSSLPTDVQIGITFKPKYMPFRFSFTGYNLVTKQATYYDASVSKGNTKPSFADQVFRHINIGIEIIFDPNFHLRAGYNQLVRKELRLSEKIGLGGISLGFMAKLKGFELAYTFTTFHVSGGRNYISIHSNLNRLFKKKLII